MPPYRRLRKHLEGVLPAPVWPAGIRLGLFADVDPKRLHRLLGRAYAHGGGAIAPFETWHARLVGDEEYDPELCIVALDGAGEVAGFVQCWTSGFVKDLAVASAHRRRGLGEALMREAFVRFAARGVGTVDLKVEAGNAPAERLYARLGMVEVDR